MGAFGGGGGRDGPVAVAEWYQVLALLFAGLCFAHGQHVGLGVYGHVLGCFGF